MELDAKSIRHLEAVAAYAALYMATGMTLEEATVRAFERIHEVCCQMLGSGDVAQEVRAEISRATYDKITGKTTPRPTM